MICALAMLTSLIKIGKCFPPENIVNMFVGVHLSTSAFWPSSLSLFLWIPSCGCARIRGGMNFPDMLSLDFGAVHKLEARLENAKTISSKRGKPRRCAISPVHKSSGSRQIATLKCSCEQSPRKENKKRKTIKIQSRIELPAVHTLTNAPCSDGLAGGTAARPDSQKKTSLYNLP